MSEDDISVQHEPELSRYVLKDGDTEIGEERYLDVAGDGGTERAERILHHTEVTPDREGEGLASRLVQHVVDDTVAAGRAVVPVCPYVAAWLDRHPEHADHVVAPTAAHRAELERRAS